MNTQEWPVMFTPEKVRTDFTVLAVTWWISMPLSLTGLFLPILGIIWVPLIIVATVYWCILLYRHWLLLQGHGARTTPGKAVGFGFIPIFFFYWWFYSYAGLATDNNRYLTECGLKPRMSFNLAVYYCVVGVLSMTIGLIPFIGTILTVPMMIVGFMLATQQRDCILAMLEHRAQAAQASPPPMGTTPPLPPAA